MKLQRFNKPLYYTILLSLILAIIRLFIAGNTGLGVGESYYARGVTDLQLSYFDQPPLFFWLSRLSVNLLGFNHLGLRLPAILLFFGTSMLVYATAAYFYNQRTGFYAVLLINSSFVFTLPIATWFQPDAPLMFFWMLSIYFLARILFPKDSEKSQGRNYLEWIILGISLGLASLSKYHSVFLFFGTFMFLLLNKDYRFWLKHPAPYLAILIHFIMLLPVFIWNAENEWISFTFQGARAGTGNEFTLHPDWFLRSVIGQSIWLLPWIWFWLIQQLVRSTKKGFSDLRQSFFFWLSVSPILFFTLITLWADTQFHFHWQAPGYMVLFIPLGYHFYKNQKASKVARKLWLGFGLCFVLASFLALHMVTGFWQKWGPGQITRSTGGNYDPTIEGVDFEIIKERFEEEGWMQNENIFLATASWWQCGKIDWALQCKKPVIIFSNDPRNYAYFGDPRNNIGKDAVFVRFKKDQYPDKISEYFDEISQMDNIPIVRGGVLELELEVFFCRNFGLPVKPDKNEVIDRQLMGLSPFVFENE